MKKLNLYRIQDNHSNKLLMQVKALSTESAKNMACRRFPVGSFKVVLVNTALFEVLSSMPDNGFAA